MKGLEFVNLRKGCSYLHNSRQKILNFQLGPNLINEANGNASDSNMSVHFDSWDECQQKKWDGCHNFVRSLADIKWQCLLKKKPDDHLIFGGEIIYQIVLYYLNQKWPNDFSFKNVLTVRINQW